MKGKNHWQRQKCSKGSGSNIYKANMEVKDKSSKTIYINNNYLREIHKHTKKM